jgi:hypothetical protein
VRQRVRHCEHIRKQVEHEIERDVVLAAAVRTLARERPNHQVHQEWDEERTQELALDVNELARAR